jgi:hypothetical protein
MPGIIPPIIIGIIMFGIMPFIGIMLFIIGFIMGELIIGLVRASSGLGSIAASARQGHDGYARVFLRPDGRPV